MKPKVLMITDIPFWLSGAGHIARLAALVRFLTKHAFLTVVMLGRQYEKSFVSKHDSLNVIFLANENKADKEQNLVLLNRLFEFDYYKLCIIEYINHAYFLKCIPEEVVVLLDAHDIISDRNSSFQSHGYSNWDYSVSQEQEYKIYNYFDYVAFVSAKDYKQSLGLLPKEKMILVPHPVSINHHPFREQAEIIGFMASDYLPNVDAIVWFLEEVWSHIPKTFNLHVYGMVCRKIPKRFHKLENVILKGFAESIDLFYKGVDVVINPVRFGAGLKIKNMEALAHGIPLLTTSHGAGGLEAGANSAYMVADSAIDFKEKLIYLVSNPAQRSMLSHASKTWVSSAFGEENCFHSVKQILEK